MKNIHMEQIAAMNMHYQRVSFSAFLDSLERLKIRQFELWAGAPHYYNPDHDPVRVKSLSLELRKRNLKVVCFTPEQCLYPINIASPDASLRKKSIDYFNSYIRQASELEVGTLLLTSGWGHYDEEPEEGWKRCFDSVEILLRRAEKEKLVLSFEILQDGESNLVNSFASLQKIMTSFDSPFLACCIDTVPVCAEGKTLEDYFIAFGNRINHIHLNDGKPAGHLTWGDGTQNLKQHLDTLDRYNYSKAMTLEIGDPGYFRDPENALKKGLDYIRPFFS